MSNKQISQFPLTDVAQPNDFAHIIRGGEDRSILISDLVPVIGSSANAEVQTLNNGVEFTGGFTNNITLSTSVVNKEVMHIFFDGIYQEKDTYELNGNVVTFPEPIPAWIQQVEIVIPLSLPLASVNANDIEFKDGFTYSWPLADGEETTVLSTNGSGELSWKAPTDLPRAGWKEVGNAVSMTVNADPVVCGLTPTRVVLVDDLDDLRVFDFDGTDWTQTGNTFDPGFSASYPGICRLSPTDFAFAANNTVYRYTFDGTNISLVGNSYVLPTSTGLRPSLCFINDSSLPRVLLFSKDQDEVYLIEHDGTDWSILDTLALTLNTCSCASLGNVTAVVQNEASATWTFLRVSASTISVVDTITSPLGVSQIDSMAGLSLTDFCYADNSGNMFVFRWDEANSTVRQLGPTYTNEVGGRSFVTPLGNAGVAVLSYLGDYLQRVDFDYYTDVPTITGSRGGNAALASILTALDDANLIIDNTTA